MKKILLFLLAVFCLNVFNFVEAQDLNSTEEAILSFSSDVFVNTDNSVNVVETIIYNTGSQERHGIYRDIYPYSSQNRKMSIEDISVVDENNNAYIFQVSYSGENFIIKIGDPSKTFNGQKIYIIKYRATKAVAQLEDLDEIYWNVTGNAWNIPIYKAQANVILPGGIEPIQSACYFGPKGSTNKCFAERIDGAHTFISSEILAPGNGLTLAVGFAKGLVTPYTKVDDASQFVDKYKLWFSSFILPLITLILSLAYWHKKGRDPKDTGVIVPQYDVLNGLTPLEVGAIVYEKIDLKYISAEIVYLATWGYLKIQEIENKVLGMFKTKDYELIRIKDFSSLQNDFDKKLSEKLFGSESAIKISSLKNKFYKEVWEIKELVAKSVLQKGYYKNLGRMGTSSIKSIIVAFSPILAGILIALLDDSVLGAYYFPILLSVIASLIVFRTVSRFNAAKTEKGVATKEYLLGLKEYLQIAEKDRLIFHNAPEKKPEVFEKLLPYAMILGVADIWAKEFEDIYTMPPSWYSGPTGTAFNAVTFNHSLSNFSTFAASSLGSSPGGGGSGGGGSSGGGGGGGGGGGW